MRFHAFPLLACLCLAILPAASAAAIGVPSADEQFQCAPPPTDPEPGVVGAVNFFVRSVGSSTCRFAVATANATCQFVLGGDCL